MLWILTSLLAPLLKLQRPCEACLRDPECRKRLPALCKKRDCLQLVFAPVSPLIQRAALREKHTKFVVFLPSASTARPLPSSELAAMAVEHTALPIDVAAAVKFLCAGAALALTASASNDFFHVVESVDEHERGRGEVHMLTGQGARGCWDIMPKDWREFFDTPRSALEREELLDDLAKAEDKGDWPATLREYLACVRSGTLKATKHDEIVVSSAPSTSRAASETTEAEAEATSTMRHVERLNVRARMGMSDKKAHECIRSANRVRQLVSSHGAPSRVVDVGAGRAHLSRTLARLPNPALDVLALDIDAKQIEGALYLDGIFGKFSREQLESDSRRSKKASAATAATTLRDVDVEEEPAGTLSYAESALDEEGLFTVLEGEPCTLIGLHACGDLTVNALRAFARADQRAGEQERHSLMLVGCCYNFMSPSNFPLALDIASPITERHIVLSPTMPLMDAPLPYSLAIDNAASGTDEKGYLGQWRHERKVSWHAARRVALTKLLYRARLDAEVAHMLKLERYDPVLDKELRRRPGGTGGFRLSKINCKGGWEAYRSRAMVKLKAQGCEINMSPEAAPGFGEDEEQCLWRMGVFWALRSAIGPVVESLIVLDRYEYLRRHVGEDRVVELRCLFDKRLSERCWALVVRNA